METQCPCADWQWMGVIQSEIRHYSHASYVPQNISCALWRKRGKKPISGNIVMFYKESSSSERWEILPETTLLTKLELNSIPLELSKPVKIWGETNMCFHLLSLWLLRYCTTKCPYLSDPEMLLHHVIVQQSERGSGLPGHAGPWCRKCSFLC